MHELPDPDWFFDNVLAFAEPGGARAPLLPAAAWQQWWRTRPLDGAVGRLAATQGFILATSQLAGLGVSRMAARYAVQQGRWTTAGHGAVSPVAVDGPGVDQHQRARRQHALGAAAAVLGRPDLVVSGASAAIIHGLPTSSVPLHPEVTVREDGRLGRRNRRHVHGADLQDGAVVRWFGVAVTCVGRTVVDLARHDRRGGLMAADAALRERMVPALEDHLATAAGWPGVRQAREILALASPLAESPLESLVRLGLHDAGLPLPELQVRIGRFRADMCWPEHRLVLEVDGLAKYDAAEWRREKRREQELRAAGYRVERVTWEDLQHRWGETVVRLRALLADPDPASRPKWLRNRPIP